MNNNKAYILGLMVGGGIIDDHTFHIKLPFNRWGEDPNNMSQIATDILTDIQQMFVNAYGINVSYEIQKKSWLIKPICTNGISSLLSDLSSNGLPTTGKLIKTANLSNIKNTLSRPNAEYFISGLFDARGSVQDSHRRFNDEAPIVSLEVPGSTQNFTLVVQLCSWLHDFDTYTDQILYNHPCEHAALNSQYTGWKKGFKIRFLAKSYLSDHSFAFKGKARQVVSMSGRQTKNSQPPCEQRKPTGNEVCIHKDINSPSLPEAVRGKIFFHYTHYCALLGCPYAPINELQKIARNYRKYISAYPLLVKGEKDEIISLFNTICQEIGHYSNLITQNYTIDSFRRNTQYKKYSKRDEALAFLYSVELNGKRHKGNKDTILSDNAQSTVEVFSINQSNSPIVLCNAANGRAALISTVDTDFNNQILDTKIIQNDLDVKVI